MPKNLTDVDTFTDPIVVPVGTDTRADAAGDVELLSQGLANRTRNLKNRLDTNDVTHALLAAANIFTSGPQTVNDSTGGGVIASLTYPAQLSAGNKYKEIGRFRVNATTYIRTFVGDPASAQGTYVITSNAYWDPDSLGQVWEADDTSAVSHALFFGIGANDVLFTERAAGAGTWASWSTTTSALSTAHLGVVDAYDLNADNDANIDGDCIVAGNFLYTSAKSRTTGIPLAKFLLTGSATISNFGRDGLLIGTDIAICELDVPAGAIIDQVDVLVKPDSTGVITLRAHRRTAADFATPTAGTGSEIDSDGSDGTANLQTLSVNFGSLTVAQLEEYWISVDGAQANDKIWAARIVSWTDPGPRNI